MRRGLQTLHRLARQKGEEVAEQRATVYQQLITTTEQTLRQAARVRQALAEAGDAAQGAGRRLREQIDHFTPLVGQVIHQARVRVLDGGKVPALEKVVSLFEPHSRVIPRHKGGALVEFGRTVVFDEVEGGIVTRFHVLEDEASEHGELAPALQHHRAVFARPPTAVTADRGMHAPDNERVAREAGVTHLVIPAWGKATATQQAREKDRAWRRCYHWRAGLEGRISSLRGDYGLARCPEHGADGLERHVGWGVIASNLCHIGQAVARRMVKSQVRVA
jgi:IS5 family transposase